MLFRSANVFSMRCIISVAYRGNAKRAGRDHSRPRDHDSIRSIAETKLLDELPVSIDFRALHVVQEPAALADELEQPLTTVVILFVSAEMVRQIVDALREQRNLNASRSTVRLMRRVLLDGRAFFESHLSWKVPAPARGIVVVFCDSLVA